MPASKIVAAVGATVLAALIVAAPRLPVSRATTTPAAPSCPANAKKANLNFTLKNVDGKAVQLADFRGKVILLDFWATWCGPCKIEIPGFIDLYAQYRDQGLQVLGFSVDDPVPALKDYAAQMKMNYPILVGMGHEDVQDAFGPMPGLPTTF